MILIALEIISICTLRSFISWFLFSSFYFILFLFCFVTLDRKFAHGFQQNGGFNRRRAKQGNVLSFLSFCSLEQFIINQLLFLPFGGCYLTWLSLGKILIFVFVYHLTNPQTPQRVISTLHLKNLKSWRSRRFFFTCAICMCFLFCVE